MRIRHFPRDRYAENQTRIDPSTRPVFITVLKSRLGDENELAAEAKAIAGTVSGLLGRPVQNTHVLFQPDAAGRIAFGIELVRLLESVNRFGPIPGAVLGHAEGV